MSKSRNLTNFRFVASKKRARLLNRRGEFIFWDKVYECWVWEPDFRQQLLAKQERLPNEFSKVLHEHLEDIYATN